MLASENSRKAASWGATSPTKKAAAARADQAAKGSVPKKTSNYEQRNVTFPSVSSARSWASGLLKASCAAWVMSAVFADEIVADFFMRFAA